MSVAVQRKERPFWQRRYYDFNVFTSDKRTEKLRYMHHNPVKRGLVKSLAQWPWSSFRHYATGEHGTVEIESEWLAAWPTVPPEKPTSQKRDVGHPKLKHRADFSLVYGRIVVGRRRI